MKKLCMLLILLFNCFQLTALELVIGEEIIKPGIVFVFEGAVKDTIHPHSLHLSENNTQVHIEARVNWDTSNIPQAAVPGGFIPYLYITSKIINEQTGLISFIDLLPHLNLIDNFHYARNIFLPGSPDNTYTVIFNVNDPQKFDLSFHKDWLLNYGEQLFEPVQFTYKNINFKEIVQSSRS